MFMNIFLLKQESLSIHSDEYKIRGMSHDILYHPIVSFYP
jgi:hypothetical protein